MLLLYVCMYAHVLCVWFCLLVVVVYVSTQKLMSVKRTSKYVPFPFIFLASDRLILSFRAAVFSPKRCIAFLHNLSI